MKKTTLRITAPQYEMLARHLFPGDGDEHGAVILAGISDTSRETRFLAREVILAREGVDYGPGRFGYRALTADFVARVSHRCARERLCYFAVHCHGGSDTVGFSETDLESHQRGYPALLDITRGGPVGALVFARNAVAGEIWTTSGITPLHSLTVVGENQRQLFSAQPRFSDSCGEAYHRQSLLFGAVGQRRLAGAKVGIIGLGGVGSLVNEWLAHLGIGEIVAIDYDRLEPSNRSRVVGSRAWDSKDFLRASPIPAMRKLGERWATHKVRIAERVARAANRGIKFQAVVGNVIDEKTANLLCDTDFIFLCADSMQSRLVFNALVHQYLIPGVQIGSKISVAPESGELGDIFSVSRPVFPHFRGGCLLCNQLVSAARLQREAITGKEREQQAYVNDPDVKAPSVITLNALGAAQAANDFLFSLLGLRDSQRARSGYLMHYAQERVWRSVDCAAEDLCLHCGSSSASALGRGDRAHLPCRNTR